MSTVDLAIIALLLDLVSDRAYRSEERFRAAHPDSTVWLTIYAISSALWTTAALVASGWFVFRAVGLLT